MPLLKHLARQHPEWQLVILGPIAQGVVLPDRQRYPNLHFMGNRPLETMPAYLKGFDVALIPYALNEATRGIYPMKTQEYLAGGKPVVSPRLPECLALRRGDLLRGGSPGFRGQNPAGVG